jgi:hypothetical protein
MKRFLKRWGVGVSLMALPFLAFAQYNFNGGYFQSILTFIQGIMNVIFPILTIVALVIFFYELIMFIKASPDEKTKRRPGVIWSVVALFVLLSIFGIIRILQNITGVSNGPAGINSSNIPSVQF